MEKNLTSLDLEETLSHEISWHAGALHQGEGVAAAKAHSPTNPTSEAQILGWGPTVSHLWEPECCHSQEIKACVSGFEVIKDGTHLHVAVAGT